MELRNLYLCEERRRKTSEAKKSLDGRTAFDNDYSRIVNSSFMRRLQDKAQVFPLKEGDFVRSRLTHSLEVSHFGHSMGLSISKYLIENSRKKLGKNEEILKLKQSEIGKISGILSTAGLVHDLGNPPFGHFGETIIKEHFNELFKKITENKKNKGKFFVFDLNNKELKELPTSDKEINNYILSDTEHILSWDEIIDLCSYDGNAQTFRILSKLHYMRDEKSFNLTLPTLSSIVKYPKLSVNKDKKKEKFGYFLSEKEIYEEIKEKLVLNGRHPLTYLLEAADDIAYSVADIEDGVKKRIFNSDYIQKEFEKYLSKISKIENNAQLNSQKDIINFLENEIGANKKSKKKIKQLLDSQGNDVKKWLLFKKEIKELERTIDENELENVGYFEYFSNYKENMLLKNKTEETKAWFLLKRAIFLLKYFKDKKGYVEIDGLKLQELRVFIQNKMIIYTEEYFIENLEKIDKFELGEKNILEESTARHLRKAVKEVSKKIFVYSEIVDAEILGHKVINTILKELIECVISPKRLEKSSYEGKIYSLISYNYKFLNLELSPYKKIYGEKDAHIYDRLRMVIDFVSGMTDTYALNLYKKLILK